MNKTRRYWYGRSVVYRCFDESGRLLYIGTSISAPSRFAQHKTFSWWWPLVSRVRMTVHPSQEAARTAEQEAIRQEAPAFNIRRAGMPDVLREAHWTAADQELRGRFDREQLRRYGVLS